MNNRKTSVFIIAALLLFYSLIGKIVALHTVTTPTGGSAMLRKTNSDDHIPFGRRKTAVTVIAIIAIFITITAVTWFSAAEASDGGNPGTPSYRDTVGNLVYAISHADARSLFQLVPAEMIDSYLLEEGIEKRDLMEQVQQELELAQEELLTTYGEEWNITHEILDARQILEDELLQLQEEYRELELEISEALVVDLALMVESDSTAEDANAQILLLKIGGSWYITGEFLNILN
jgi:hypothetical protein